MKILRRMAAPGILALLLVLAAPGELARVPPDFRPHRTVAETLEIFTTVRSDLLRALRDELARGDHMAALRLAEPYAPVGDDELQNLRTLARMQRDRALESLDKDGQERALALEDVRREMVVRSAAWTSPSVILLGVDDTGERRDGFARYACRILARHGQISATVRVVDQDASFRRQWRELGSCRCEEAPETAKDGRGRTPVMGGSPPSR